MPQPKRKNKWLYDFNCKKCANIQKVHDDSKNRNGFYCIPCVERFDAGKPALIHADEDFTLRCDCYKELSEQY